MTLLKNIRVVVMADHLTDFAGSMLARLGADVVLAGSTPRAAAREKAWQRGMTPSNAPLDDLLVEADIFLDDRRSGDYPERDKIAALHEKLVHIVATGWSEQAGHRPVTDITLMAQSGLMSVIGTPDKPPLRLPGEQAYALTSIQVTTAALMGLRARRLTGKGQRITLSALQSTALANYREAVMFDWTGRIGKRQGNMLVRGRSGVRQIWPCADGYVTWSMIDNPGMMYALVRVMESEGCAGELSQIDWAATLVADTDQDIIERWQAVVGVFFKAFERQKLADWSLEHGWGLSPIVQITEVQNHPQMKARGVFENGLPGPLFAVHYGDQT